MKEVENELVFRQKKKGINLKWSMPKIFKTQYNLIG